MERLLAKLGHPERHLPPVVHVAGTNGKGSTIAFLEAILGAAGYRVLSYTSPHLVRFAERIRIKGKTIAEDHLAATLEECERIDAGAPITFFEITTAAAFLAFARADADIALLEVGLGGRLDATNVIERPLLSVVTPISIDHTQYLGSKLGAIAKEKAAILKPGVAAVIGRQSSVPARIIAHRARKLGVPLIRFGRDFKIAEQAARLVFRDGVERLSLPLPALDGPHQIDNAGLAIACARALAGFEIGTQAIAQGLRTPAWPGRLQHVTRGRLAARLPEGWELWIDGGHNAAAGAALAKAIEAWTPGPLHLVVGMLNSKDPKAFLSPLAALAADLRGVPVPGEAASLEPEAISTVALALNIPARPEASVAAALDDISAKATRRRASNGGGARVLICGSLYLVGSVLAADG